MPWFGERVVANFYAAVDVDVCGRDGLAVVTVFFVVDFVLTRVSVEDREGKEIYKYGHATD